MKPEMRFEGFEGEWDVIKLNEIASIKGGYAFPSGRFKYKKDRYQVIKMGNLYKNQLLLERSPSYLKELVLHEEDFLLKPGDIIITLTGTVNKTDYGYSHLILNEGNLLLNQRLALVKAKDNTNSAFLINIIRHKRFLRQFFKSSTGGTGNQANVSTRNIEGFEVRVPALPEQQKIASFFTLLDWKIEKHEEKIEKLEELKKGMMQKVFSREIRFKDENGGEFTEWEEQKLGQVLKIKHGKDQKEIEVSDGKYPILGTGGEMGRTDTAIYEKESVLIGRKGTIDRPFYKNSPFWTVDTLFYSEINEEYDPKFIYFLFQTINWKKYNEASGVPSLSAKTIESIIADFPIKEEQQKISAYLSVVDKKIGKEKVKLNQLQEEKKGFMQRMFV